MKEFWFIKLAIIAGAATTLAACTAENESSPSTSISQESIKVVQQTPIEFGTYMGEQAVTRAGYAGPINNVATLADDNYEFGVFAYYTNNENYAAAKTAGHATPNFMYNQRIQGAVSATPGVYNWTYSPVKYWPNEFSTDKLSFFAYAPYVTGYAQTNATTVNGATWTPAETVGITALSGNNYSGDPVITYAVAADPSQSVDLMYGVAAENITDGPVANNITAGNPLIDLTKQSKDGVIKFNFKHALARLSFTIQGVFNSTTFPSDDNVEENTKITVQSVAINGANFYTSGALNLNDGTWGSLSAAQAGMTINTYLNASIKDAGTDTDIEEGLFTNGSITGVTKTEVALGTGADYMIIPNVAPSETSIASITITYFVNTNDPKLAKTYSRVKNVITCTFDTDILEDGNQPISIVKGNAYNFKLKVGMTTVKVDASVSPWTTNNQEVWVPVNED